MSGRENRRSSRHQPAFDAEGRLKAPAGAEIPELCRLSASELRRLLDIRRVSAVEVAEVHLARIGDTNPAHNAIVTLRPEQDILADAARIDEARARGEPLGALAGLPTAFKDLQSTDGIRTTFGSPIFADFVPQADSLTVARVKAAGAVVVGKTNTPEFGLGSHTYNTVFGRTRNAFRPDLSAGGSSGGAAVSLATRMLPIADGSDFGGSLRNPGAFNNVFGFRPSLGRVPNVPAKDGFFAQISTDGPMGRTVRDLAMQLTVMSGYDTRAPLALEDVRTPFEDGLDGAEGLRPCVAWLGDLGGRLPTEPGVLDLCLSALTAMESAGWRIDPVTPEFDFAALWSAFVTLRQFAIIGSHGEFRADPSRWSRLKPEMQWEMTNAFALDAATVSDAALMRSAWRETALALLSAYDVLALPTAQVFPFPVDWDWPKQISGVRMDSYHRWFEVAAPASLTGFPTVNLPAGFDGDGRPMGLQLIGRPRDDLGLLRIAAAFEAAAPRG